MLVRKKVRKLERIKDIREKLRDETRARLGEAEDRKKILLGQVSDLGNKKDAALENFRDVCGHGHTTTEELWWIRDNIDSLEKEIGETEHLIDEVNKDMESIMADLVRKHGSVKLAEAFLEDSSRELRKQLLKDEQKELDERALMIFRQ